MTKKVNKIIVLCSFCGTEMLRWPSHLSKNGKNYHSKECWWKDTKERGPLSSETKKKISERVKENKPPISEETRQKLRDANLGKNNPSYGRKDSEETRKKRSESHKGLPGPNKGKYGHRNYNWKGGSSFFPYPETFNAPLKCLIKERDGFKCMYPGCDGSCKKLDVHHIDYDKQNCVEENLITLCSSHNCKVNANREHWKKYFKSIVRRN